MTVYIPYLDLKLGRTVPARFMLDFNEGTKSGGKALTIWGALLKGIFGTICKRTQALDY